MDAKTAATEKLRGIQRNLIDLSHRIHANPELGFEERLASTWLCEMLADAGFKVEAGVCDLPTAFIARAGSGPLHVAICAEYDCLPQIGHACGHNLISAMAAGAGIAAAKIADEVGLTVSVFGTPAEEVGDGGGKVLMLERGGFEGIHAAMMVHPAPVDTLDLPGTAITTFDVHYTGKEAHAAAYPELGVNALDALTVAQTAIGLLRQHIRPTDRVHGIITHGGDVPNVVPAHTKARFMVRANTIRDLDDIRNKVFRCFEAGALATGSTLEIVGGTKPYAELHPHPGISALYARNAETLGRTFIKMPAGTTGGFSTDMGNVSLAIPSIHPTIGIASMPAVNHQPEFTAHCIKPEADKALVDGSLAMVWTAIDLASDQTLRDQLINRPTAS
jgi:amidohydrolase